MSRAQVEAEESRPGRTTISARALQRLSAAVAMDAAEAGPRDVTVTLSDDAGSLRVGVVVPARLGVPVIPIPEQSARVREGVIAGMRDLGGRSVSSVDVRFVGVHRMAERRAA